MNTDDLIDSLTADTRKVAPSAMRQRLAPALAVGSLASFLGLLLWLGLRPDLPQAFGTAPYWIKLVFTAAIGVVGVGLSLRLGRPGAHVGRLGWLALTGPLALVWLAGALQLASAPAAEQPALWLGQSWRDCPVRILALSVPLLIASLLAMRRFAPTRPALAGLAAGMAAGGLSASIYGLYCQETSIAFLATWYVLGMASTAAVGAVVGARLLRW